MIIFIASIDDSDEDESVVQLTTSDNGSLRVLELTTSTGRHFSFGDVGGVKKRSATEGVKLVYCSGRTTEEGHGNITFHWAME